ncbi:MAG: GtrA family protein [Bacteroidales bacterium]|nr:GtrA family protein [Bacteroidales bacterium]
MVQKIKDLIHKLLTPEFIRFIFVAALNTAFGWTVFAVLRYLLGFTPLKEPFVLAAFLGTIISVLFNFKTYGKIVFKVGDNRLIFKFVIVCAITYFVNIFGIGIMEYFGVNNYWAGAIMTIPVGLLNYIFNKIFTFVPETKPRLWWIMCSILAVEIVIFLLLRFW